MKTNLYLLYLLLLPALLLSNKAQAQTLENNYTSNNKVMVSLLGPLKRYDFASRQLLVRLNRQRQQLECIIPVASLVPLNDSIPPAMAYHALFGAKYPELRINIHLNEQPVEPDVLQEENDNIRTASIELQGVNNETRIPVAITSENNTYFLSTNFDLMLDNFRASLPAEYLPLLTGRIIITIDQAQWADFNAR